MASQNERLARALEVLNEVQMDGIVRSSDISRTYRDRLVKAEFLSEIINGWLYVTHPGIPDGASVSWYGAFWKFVSLYLQSRFGDDYCLSPEASIKLHIRSTVIPTQITLMVHENIVQTLILPSNTSLFIFPTKEFPTQRVQIDGIWVMDLPSAITKLSEPFYRTNPEDAEIALRMIRDAGALLHLLLEGSNVVVAGRLIGAYNFLGYTQAAQQIRDAMEAAGNIVRISNPFERSVPMLTGATRIASPHVARIQGLWARMRGDVLRIFEAYPTREVIAKDYLAEIEARYVTDAYNSLSIEGYRVTPELIERVRQGAWNPASVEADNKENDALAARGYFQAFQAVKQSIVRTLEGDDSAAIIEREFQSWYREMFSPAVTAGILKASQLAGYRNNPVYLRGSRYVPPAADAIIDCMDAFLDLLRRESQPIVRSVLGHFIFVYIHPYSDGNGRIGRFLMNAALAGGGYPWTIIRQEHRAAYLAALEDASVHHDIGPFARFVLEEMQATDK